MNNKSRHTLRGYMDMYYTMEPEKARRWMKRIDQLPRQARNHELEEFERVKEGYYDGTKVLNRGDRYYGMLRQLLDQYWTARDDYHGGYYWQYMPEPLVTECQTRYFERVGLMATVLNEQFVLMSQGIEPVDFFYLMALRCDRERDRVYQMIRRFDELYAGYLRDYWLKVCDMLMFHLTFSERLSAMSGVEDARHLMDNYVMTGKEAILRYIGFDKVTIYYLTTGGKQIWT